MLHSIKKLDYCRVLGRETEVGSVADTYFDDEKWVVRYLWVWSGAMPAVRPTDEKQICAARQRLAEVPNGREADPHLRSSRQVMGYRIEASGASIGYIEDFLFDLETWALRYVVVHTRSWLWGKRVLISPERIRRVNWSERSVLVDLRRDAVRDSPAYDRDRSSRKPPSTRGHTST